MSAITKAAALVLVSGLLTGTGAVAASAADTVPATDGTTTVVQDPAVEAPATPAPVTQEEVDAAFAAFKKAQADALASEKTARLTARAREAAALQLVKSAKGTAKKTALRQFQALVKADQLALKNLKTANAATVNAARAAYQELAALYEEQNAAAL